ncbi:MAG: gas vesicle protein GvpN [Chloroflexi bacterium]|nr:gas vesicle protein GvpN [Chloroflexota bacterium]
MSKDGVVLLNVQADAGFVETDRIRELIQRSMAYVKAGYPVHFCGPAGSGKTTLALRLAEKIGRPAVLVYGDDETRSSDLVGGPSGFFRRRVVDNFVHTVLKTEESVSQHWADQRLLVACRDGLTMVYDEFTRSRPEANNVLLSILEERVLPLPNLRMNGGYIKVHPNFVAIFTSNPEDYVGVHETQDALRDRMVTIYLDPFDRETEMAITQSRSGIPREQAEVVVDVVRAFREAAGHRAKRSIRDSIKVAKVLVELQARAAAADPTFVQTCRDMLVSHIPYNEASQACELLRHILGRDPALTRVLNQKDVCAV